MRSGLTRPALALLVVLVAVSFASSATGQEEPDTTAPETTITAGPADGALVSSASATFEFESSEAGSTFECRIDAEAFLPCDSPKPYSGLAEGEHTFRVRATDTAGNTDDTPATRTWTVDTVPPNTSITSGPSGTVNSTDASFGFESTDPSASFECRLDGGAWSVCTSPKLYTGLAQGSHTFEVRAEDAAGNEDPTPPQRTWTVDTAEPNTTITSGPSGTVSSTSATFAFESTEAGSTFQCRLDGGAWSGCTSPKQYTGLAEGSHTFEVRASDDGGNVDPSPAERTWTVDVTPPGTSIDGGPSGTVASASASFSFFSGDPGATFECDLDGDGWSACSSPKNYNALADGSHTFRVRAVDEAGNRDATPAERTWRVDTTKPVTTLTRKPADPTRNTAARFAFSAEAGSTFECRLDRDAWEPCTSPQRYEPLAEGRHTFAVQATDAVGNEQVEPTSHEWEVDTTPTARVGNLRAKVEDPIGPWGVVLRWANPGDDDLARVVVRRRPGGVVCSGLRQRCADRRLRPGRAYRYKVIARDAAGNTAVRRMRLSEILLAPRDGARLSRKPRRYDWQTLANTSYYHFQLWRLNRRGLPARRLALKWPAASQVTVGRKLKRGRYGWWVWRGIGARSDARFQLVGRSVFTKR